MSGTIHVFDLLEKPLAKPPSGVCSIFGGERFLKKLAVDFLIRSIGGDDPDFAATQYDSETVGTTGWADVHDELATRSLFGGDGPRIVVVDHADKFVKENRERIEDYVGAPASSGLMILIVDSWASNTRLYKAVNKSGLQIKCDPPTKSPKSKQTDEKRTGTWLVNRAKESYGFQMPAGGAQTLIQATDCEFGRMDQELQKLALYAVKGKVDQAIIKKVVGGWRTRTMWEAIDAAADGEAGKAIELLDQLLRSGEHPLALFGQLSWSLRRYATATELVMRDMRNGKKPNLPNSIKEAGFKVWGGEIEAAQTRIRQLGRDRAGLMLDWLLEADLALKRSHSKDNRGRLVLEKLFVKMAKELGPQAA
ncbi:MAG: DNA polymerase III subunit delta [Mariniblastus sp.]